MGEAISWIAVNNSGEVCLDSDLPPLPRGWERCLDLQSGIMYLKQMNTQPGASNSDGNGKSRATHKRQRVLLGDDEGEGDPALQLTLSLPTSTDDSNRPRPSNQSSLSDANSLINNGMKLLTSQGVPTREDATTTSSNGSSPSHNACSSSSSSSPPSKYKQFGFQTNVGLRTNQLNKEKSLIKAAGCPHCFMYVLPSKSNPKCPRCKSSILVDLSPLTIH